ncbi:MAG TPA: hypothetical protein VG476_15700, partial [Acidimicrobiales bacterium]|nr:hypothetical protein [Acidimicrobiales bacterium]
KSIVGVADTSHRGRCLRHASRVATGYSGTPLVKKLGLKEGNVVALLDAPAGWSVRNIGSDVQVHSDLRCGPDMVIAFIRSVWALRRQAGRLVKAVPPAGALWVAWPRRAGGHVSDVTEQSLRDELLPTGLVDNKVAALDQDWSGLRFVWRKGLREGLARSRAKT